MERRVEGGLRRLLARHVGKARADLVERERVVAHEPPVLLDEGQSRLGGLVVPLDRRRLPETAHALVAEPDQTTSAVSCDSRAITNVSASGSETIRAEISTPGA